MYQIRRIKPHEIPTILDSQTDEERPRTEAELLQLGIVALGYDDLYDVAHVDGTPEPRWGRKIAEGFDRYTQISGPKKDNVLRARVYRAGDHNINLTPEQIELHRRKRAARGLASRIEQTDVPRNQVRESDSMVQDRIVPKFAGEA